jgi:hypothetical protein
VGGAVNFETVAQEISDQLGTILKGQSTPYAPDTGSPPLGYVFGIESAPHQSYANGLTRLKLSVTVAVARTPLDVAFKALSGYMSDTGDTSVKACLESGTYTAFDTLVVTRSVVGDVTIGGAPYKGAQFDLDITGTGA